MIFFRAAFKYVIKNPLYNMAICNLSNFVLCMLFYTVTMAQVSLSCTIQITVRHYLSGINFHAFSYAFNSVSAVLKVTINGNHFT
jgi:hypothetical protein